MKPDDKPKTEPKPEKTKVLQVQLLVTLEVDDGDFAAVTRAIETMEEIAETVEHKKTRTVTR